MRHLKIKFFACGIAALFALTANAQWIWTGAENNNFSNPENWLVGGSVPASGPSSSTENYEFNLAGGGTIEVDGNFGFNSITFGSSAGSFTFNGGQLRGSGGQFAQGFTRTINQNSSATQTFNTAFNWMNTNAQNFVLNANSGDLILSNVGVSNQGVGYSINGDHKVSIGNVATDREIRRFTGNGTLEITGSTNRTSTYDVDLHTMLVTNTSGNALGGTNPTFQSGSRLAGTGTVSSGTLTFNDGGIISPGMHGNNVPSGNEIGTLTSNNMVLNEGFVYDWDFTASDSDRFVLTGELNLSASNSDLSVINLIGDMNDFDPFSNNVLFSFDTVEGASDGTVLSWSVNNNGSETGYFAVVSGNDVILSIPEPGTLMFILFAGLLGMAGYRRRRN
ncbi:MAG: PEP-CTERM sorting domain-containing protein [Verrucomicrobia bacterium]|nr:PEP-CTERM sorting domain-containing protein [Verrucomicrobiota bacterium]MCH8514021.1 PEP-CTERM sorting domain-containing protein [Kiritimatiellia bacterium]